MIGNISTEVDILLPTYNGEKYIYDQIQSILKQSFKNFNLVISDDCSTDRTVEIVKSIMQSEPRITLIENKNNLGLVKNVEKLLVISNAKYILFSDQDDYWFEEKVESLYNFIKEKEAECLFETPILVHSNCLVTDQNLKVKRPFIISKNLKPGINNILFQYYLQSASCLINKTLKSFVLPFIDDVYIHDRYIHILAELFGKRYFLNTHLMYYRQHTSNLVGDNSLIYKIVTRLKCMNFRYYIEVDKKLYGSIYKKYPNDIIKAYLKITDSSCSLSDKIKLILRYKIYLNLKTKFLFLFNI